jgi:hypothetical protein
MHYVKLGFRTDPLDIYYFVVYNRVGDLGSPVVADGSKVY